MKKRLLNGEEITFVDVDDNMIRVWFQPKTNHFCLELNCKVVKATKTWQPIKNKLETFRGLLEDITA